MTDAEEKLLYDAAFARYCDLFGAMDSAARALWFFTMDEAEILSFHVPAGHDHQEASVRHGVKLVAMADALEALLGSHEFAHEVHDIRRIAVQHGYRVKT